MITHVVCYSGGKGSGEVAVEVVHRYGPDNVILLNHNINSVSEDDDIQRYKEELASYLRISITYANMKDWGKRDQFDVCMEAKAFKVGIHPLCTNRLKTAPFHSWLDKNYPVDPLTGRNDKLVIYYGFEPHEKERIKRRTEILAKKGYKSAYPLADWQRTIQCTSDIGVFPPNTYDIWKHANCTGCLRAGKQHWYVVYCRRPDVWEKAKYAEHTIGYSILKDSFLKDLEPMFMDMKAAGIQADEKLHAATFWSIAKKTLKGLGSQIAKEDDLCGGCDKFGQLEFSF